MRIPNIFSTILASSVLIVANATCFAEESPAELRGEIIEVKGAFFKIEAPDAEGLAVGDRGVIESGTDSAELSFVVSAVTDDYIVGKATGAIPKVGAKVRFDLSLADMPAWDDLLEETIDVQLSTGRSLEGVVLKEVAKDDDDAPVAILIEMTKVGQATRLSFSTISKISSAGRVVFQANNSDAVSAAMPDIASDARASSGASSPSKTRKQILDERAAKLAAEKKKANEEEQKKWRELANRNRVRIWPEYSEEDRTADIKKEKEIAEKLKEELPTLALYETKYFLVFSNANPNDVASVARNLDMMHVLVSKMYQVDTEKVYKGTAIAP